MVWMNIHSSDAAVQDVALYMYTQSCSIQVDHKLCIESFKISNQLGKIGRQFAFLQLTLLHIT